MWLLRGAGCDGSRQTVEPIAPDTVDRNSHCDSLRPGTSLVAARRRHNLAASRLRIRAIHPLQSRRARDGRDRPGRRLVWTDELDPANRQPGLPALRRRTLACGNSQRRLVRNQFGRCEWCGRVRPHCISHKTRPIARANGTNKARLSRGSSIRSRGIA